MKPYPKIEWHIGIDEAGRGPLAGPVTLGFFAVTSAGKKNPQIKQLLSGVRDSKKLTRARREELFHLTQKISAESPDIRMTTVSVSAKIIEQKGISRAIRGAIATGLRRFGFSPESCNVLLDGSLKAPAIYLHQETIIQGDDIEPLISAASILAKVTRDRYMVKMHKKYPQYGFAQHKGYGTRQHYAAIKRSGVCELHRVSWIQK
ncbi:ribonuclease HII [Candidatus Nomurabacteria bacterium]|nr:ribonuclease HII [Candidatus Nomurabacteria bacterium]